MYGKNSYEVTTTEQTVYYYLVEAESEAEVQKMIDDDELPECSSSDCVDSQTEIRDVTAIA